MRHTKTVCFMLTAVVLSAAMLQPGFAQTLTSDARTIALGGAGDALGETSSYRSIPVPFGLFQVFKNRNFFDPNDAKFDPVRALEYASDPMHVTLNRNSDTAGNLFVNNVVKGKLNRDLNTYRGFSPSPEIKASGLISPSFGKTFTVSGNKTSDNSHGIFVGVGPYISLGTDMKFDPTLIGILSSPTPTTQANTTFTIGDTTTGQAAYAITGGYRGRFKLGGLASKNSGGGRDGVHVAANYHFIRGLHYDAAAMALRFDTDGTGLVTLAPSTVPLTVNRTTSTSGNGMALDLSTTVVTGHWEVGASVDGVGNRITWKQLRATQYALPSVLDIVNQGLPQGGVFVKTPMTLSSTEQRVTLPVRYAGNGGYHTKRWAAMSEVGRGMQGFNFGSGAEYHFGPLAFRGGGRYTRKMWHGATGVGLTIFKGFAIDAAAFQTSANIETDRRISYAVSLRIGGGSKD